MKNGSFSNGEWKIMHALWAESPLSITRLTQLLQPETGWEKNTVIIMLNRLEAAGAVRWEKTGRTRFYFPVTDQNEAQDQASLAFLDTVYQGRLSWMVADLYSHKKLSEAEWMDLKELLPSLEEDGKS